MSASKSRHRTRNRRTDNLVYHRAGWQCQMPECMCPDGRQIDRSLRNTVEPWAPTIDHIIPMSEGGSDELVNKRAAHRICNQDAAVLDSVGLPSPGPPLASTIGDLCPELAKLFTSR